MFSGVGMRQDIVVDEYGTFTVALDSCDHTIVMLTGVMGEGNGKWQFSAPVELQAGVTTSLDLSLSDGKAEFVFPENDHGNRAFAAYRDFSLSRSKELWTNPPAPGDAASELAKYAEEAERLTEKYFLSPEAAEYLTLWAAVDYLDGCSALRHIHSRSAEKAALPEADGTEGMPGILDSRWAPLFYSVPGYVAGYLADMSDEPEVQLAMLRDELHTASLIDAVARNIVQRFISQYDYTDYDRGMERLERMTAGFSGRNGYLADFRAKRYFVVGSPLPDAPLKDRNGNKVKLSDFAGKYIYIDIWASWCVPCCAEVPHLKRLESELQNDRVVFVSISIDGSKAENYARRLVIW